MAGFHAHLRRHAQLVQNSPDGYGLRYGRTTRHLHIPAMAEFKLLSRSFTVYQKDHVPTNTHAFDTHSSHA